MTNLQGGITSSQLTPQAFKNSSQNSSFQDTFNSQNSSTNQSLLLVTPSTTVLRVDNGQNPAVLSASRTSTAQNVVTTKSSNNYVPAALVVLVVSVGLAVYFFNKYKSMTTPTDIAEIPSSEG
jgi:hypothetical protein